MIYIVHGEDFVKSRSLILNQQKKLNIPSKIEMDVTEVEPNQMHDHLHASSLFGEQSFVVLNVTNAGRSNLDKYLEVIHTTPENTILIIVSGKTLSKSNIFIKNSISLKAKIIENTKEPEDNIFKFIDCLIEKNRKAAYTELDRLLTNDQNEIYLLTMIEYGLRNVAIAKFESPLLAKMAPFTKSKVIKQHTNYTETKLLELYNFIYKIDKEVKLGEIPAEVAVPLVMEKVLAA